MFGLFKKKKSKETEDIKKKADKRRGQRRKESNDRRDAIRWEPEKEDRRSGKDRRKDVGTWKGHDK